jgi:hypothetical protein
MTRQKPYMEDMSLQEARGMRRSRLAASKQISNIAGR